MQDMPSPDEKAEALRDAPRPVEPPHPLLARMMFEHERVWNALIPKHALRPEVHPWGVRFLHPTKGWRTVGKRRFAVRGVR